MKYRCTDEASEFTGNSDLSTYMQELETPNEFFKIFLTEKFLNQVVEETIYTIAYRRIQVSHLNSLFGIYENVSEFV